METKPSENCGTRFKSCRWILAFLLFLLRVCQTALRQSIGMALVCMAERAGSTAEEGRGLNLPPGCNTTDHAILLNSSVAMSLKDAAKASQLNVSKRFFDGDARNHREFQWSATFEGIVLSSYYYGYLLTPLLSGYLERLVGAKALVAACTGLGAMVNLATPTLTRTDRSLLVMLRVVAGTTNGMIDPAVQSLWSAWAPRPEVGYLTAVEYAGTYGFSNIGGIFTFLISGLLCQIPIDNGWPLVFYFYGIMSMLWVVVWLLLIFNSPEQHPRISSEELKYILSETQSTIHRGKRKLHPPWRKMLSSGPVWAIIVATATFTWVYSWILSYLPTYMEDVLLFNISQNAVYSSLPFVGKFISGLLCGYLADRLLKTKMSVAFNRKMFQTIGCLGCAACMVGIGFLDHQSRHAAVVLLVMAVTLQNVTTVAFRINALDIAPRYSPFILGLSSTAAVAVSLTAPLITSAVITQKSHGQWQLMFSVIALLCLLGGLTFLVLGKAELQPWARTERQSHHIENGVITRNIEKKNDDNNVENSYLNSDKQLCDNSRQICEATFFLPQKPGVFSDKTEDKERTETAGTTLGSPKARLSPQTHSLVAEKVLDLEAASQWSSSLSLTG